MRWLGRGFARVAVLALLLVALAMASIITRSEGSGRAVIVEVSTTVDGGAVSLVKTAIARTGPNSVMVLKLNTYGGYVAAADAIINGIKASGIRCISWVPPGGKAVSAGSLIALACREVYMSPGSVIGASQPSPKDEKTVNYVRGRFRALAEEVFRGNETLVSVAERFVTENLVLTYEEAVKLGFAKPVSDVRGLLKALNVSGYELVTPGPWEYFLSLISAPVISSAMLWIGILLIVVEVLQTGFQGYVVPGVILMVLALYGMYVIPVSVLALTVLISGLALIAVEMYQPGFGVFGISGVALTAIGMYMLFTSEPYVVLTSAHYAVLGGLAAFGGLVGFIAYEAGKVRRIKRAPLKRRLVGMVGVAKTEVSSKGPGVVYVAGEDWTAYPANDEVVKPGEEVEVVRVEGLKLYVRRFKRARS